MSDLIEKRKEAFANLPQYRGTVRSKTMIRNLPEVKLGEVFWCEMDECGYVVTDVTEDHRVTVSALDENATISLGMTIYDFNKQVVSQEPLLTEKEVIEVKSQISNWFADEEMNDEYYLLYGREIHYITLFKIENRDAIADELIETLKPIGSLISMDFNTEGEDVKVIEIWMRTKEEEATMLYLMPFDRGLVVV